MRNISPRGGLVGYWQFVCLFLLLLFVCLYVFVFLAWLLKCCVVTELIVIKHANKKKEKALFFIILRQMRVFVIREDSLIFIKKVFKMFNFLCGKSQWWRGNFETRAMLVCRSNGQHSHENESRAEIRREPFLLAVFVLDKTCLYKWYSSCLM